MSSIQKVAILGASGRVGKSILPALLQSGFDVTVITRPGGSNPTRFVDESEGKKAPTVVEAAHDDIGGLTSALRGHDALIEAYNPAGAVNKRTIVRATIAAGVKHLITSEFGFDTFHPNAGELPLSSSKIEGQIVLEEELQIAAVDGKPAPLAWSAIICGTWYDFAIREGWFWLNPATRTITRFGSGNQRTSISRMALMIETVVAVLREPEQFQNRPVYIASYTVTTNELIEIAKESLGGKQKAWNVVDMPDVGSFKKQGLALWDEDRKKGLPWLGSQAFMTLSTLQIFDENNHFGADFGEKLNRGFGYSREEFVEDLRQLTQKYGN